MEKLKQPKHQFVGLMTIDGCMWCEVCDKWHYVLKGKKPNRRSTKE